MRRTNLLVTAVRRSWGLPALGPILILEVINVRDRVLPSLEHWPSALDAANGVLLVINPLIAGIVCAETLALTRGSQREMMHVLPNGVRLLASRAAATAAPIILLHLAVLTYVLIRSNAADAGGLASLFPAVPAALSVLAYSAIGIALACLLPYLVVAPLAPIGLYLLALTVQRNLPDSLVEFGGASGLLLSIRNRPEILAGQTVWLPILTSVALMLAVGTVRGYARLWPRLAIGAAVITVAGTGLGSLGDLRFEPRPVTFVCTGSDPEVCVLSHYADQLDAEADRVRSAVQQLEGLGVDLPSRFEQGTSARDDDQHEIGYFSPLRAETMTSAYGNLILDLTESVACRTDARPQIMAVSRVTAWAKASRSGAVPKPSKPDLQLREEAQAAMDEIVSCG